jgi:hypothetical protein
VLDEVLKEINAAARPNRRATSRAVHFGARLRSIQRARCTTASRDCRARAGGDVASAMSVGLSALARRTIRPRELRLRMPAASGLRCPK